LAASNLNEDGDHAPSTITLSWNYDFDNSTPLLGYIVAYLNTSEEMTSVYVNNVSNAPSYTIAELQNGNSYDFSVFGINMLGAGPSLDVSAVPSTVPDAPVVTKTEINPFSCHGSSHMMKETQLLATEFTDQAMVMATRKLLSLMKVFCRMKIQG